MHTRVYCPLLLPLYCVLVFFTILRNSNVAMFPPPRLQLSSLPPSALYLGESSPARSESHYSLQLQPTCVLCSMQASAAAQCKGLTAPCLHLRIQDLICFAACQWCLWNAKTKARLSVFFWGGGFGVFFAVFVPDAWVALCQINSFAAKYWKGWVKALQRLVLCNRWIICCSDGDKSGTPSCSHKYNVYLLWV